MNESKLRTLHLILWEEFSKKSFIIQLIVVIFLVSFWRDTIFMRSPLVILTILGTIISIPLFLLRPHYGIFGIIILTASFIDTSVLPKIPVFGGGVFLMSDMVLLMLFLFIIGKKLYYKIYYNYNLSIIRTPIDIPLVLFFLSCVISLIYSLLILKSDFHDAFRFFRVFCYYPLFFLITNMIKDKKDLTIFVRGVFFIALVTALAIILQQIVGTSLPIIFGRVEPLTKGFGKYTEVVRSIPPGLLIIYLSLITLVCVSTSEEFQGRKSLLTLQIIILGLGLLFTFYRNMWITALLAILLYFSLTTVKEKLKLILWFLIGIWALVIILLYVASSPSNILTKIVYGTQARVLSIFKIKAIKGSKSDTLGSRTMENEYAFKAFVKHPMLGIGLTAPYRPAKYWFGPRGVWGLHSSLLTIPLRFGLVGFIPFLWISVSFLVRGFRKWKKVPDPFFKAVCIGLILSYIGTLLSSVVEGLLCDWRGIIGVAIMWGTNEVIYKVEKI